MGDDKNLMDDLIEDLKRQRDEIRVQMHLAKAEAKEEFSKLEERWEDLQKRIKSAGNEAVNAGKEVKNAVGIVAEELVEAYKRVKKKLNE